MEFYFISFVCVCRLLGTQICVVRISFVVFNYIRLVTASGPVVFSQPNRFCHHTHAHRNEGVKIQCNRRWSALYFTSFHFRVVCCCCCCCLISHVYALIDRDSRTAIISIDFQHCISETPARDPKIICTYTKASVKRCLSSRGNKSDTIDSGQIPIVGARQ